MCVTWMLQILSSIWIHSTESCSCLCMCVSICFCACMYVCISFPSSLDLSLSLSLFLSLSNISRSLSSFFSLLRFLSLLLSLSLALSLYLSACTWGYVRERVCEVCEVCLKVCGFVCADKFCTAQVAQVASVCPCIHTYIHTQTETHILASPSHVTSPPPTAHFIFSLPIHTHTHQL